MKPETHNEMNRGDISAKFDLTLDKIKDDRRTDDQSFLELSLCVSVVSDSSKRAMK